MHRAIRRHVKRRDKTDALLDAYALVDQRDQGYCRVTGRYTMSNAADPRSRREHHHLYGRNARPEFRADASKIVTVCAEAHQLLTAKLLLCEGDNADGRLVFHWSEDVKPTDRPFLIRSKRWSQNEDECA
jgi:hypothetical protein